MTIKLIIYDVVFQGREVDVPELCPKCGGYLGKHVSPEDTSLIAWDFNDRGYLSTVTLEGQEANGVKVPGPFLEVVDEVGNSPGEQFIGPIALWCNCGQWSVEGTVEIREPGQ